MGKEGYGQAEGTLANFYSEATRCTFVPSIHPISDPTTSRSVCLSLCPFAISSLSLHSSANCRRKEGRKDSPSVQTQSQSRQSGNKKKRKEAEEEENFDFSAYFLFPDFCHGGAFGTVELQFLFKSRSLVCPVFHIYCTIFPI